MTALIIIAIYLVGYVLAYLLFKYSEDAGKKAWQFKKPSHYLIEDRLDNLKASVFSCLIVLVWIICVISDALPKPKKGWWKEYLNKPASW